VDFYPFDDAYLRRLCDGDKQTEVHFLGYFKDAMLLKLAGRVRSFADLDDIRQEVFYRVFSKLCGPDGLREGSKLGAYVNAFCNNVRFEFYRKEARTESLPSDVETMSDGGVNVVDALVTAETRARVQAVLAEMDARDADLLRAIFLEERDKDEICRERGVDREYLRVLLFRVKEKFRNRFGRK
jgi:RNA polymerase sigma-70 factor (ECF subfamily)